MKQKNKEDEKEVLTPPQESIHFPYKVNKDFCNYSHSKDVEVLIEAQWSLVARGALGLEALNFTDERRSKIFRGNGEGSTHKSKRKGELYAQNQSE